jgi:hypothetical protein
VSAISRPKTTEKRKFYSFHEIANKFLLHRNEKHPSKKRSFWKPWNGICWYILRPFRIFEAIC